MKQLVLITGAGGQLGQAMTHLLAGPHEVVALGRADLDLANGSAVLSAVGSICPDVIINCAAYTHVDRAEHEPEAALATNAWAVRSLARAASEINATLVHFSTDFVFDGATDRPYQEADPPNPRGAYAVSKLLGEWFASDAPTWYVLRVESLFGGPRTRSSVDKMVKALLEDREVPAFTDRTVSPSFVDDVVGATAALLSARAPSGLYHCVNSGWTSWADLAKTLAALLNKPATVVREIAMADVAMAAPRPRFAALANTKLAGLGITMPPWQDALRRHVESLDAIKNSSN